MPKLRPAGHIRPLTNAMLNGSSKLLPTIYMKSWWSRNASVPMDSTIELMKPVTKMYIPRPLPWAEKGWLPQPYNLFLFSYLRLCGSIEAILATQQLKSRDRLYLQGERNKNWPRMRKREQTVDYYRKICPPLLSSTVKNIECVTINCSRRQDCLFSSILFRTLCIISTE